MIELLDGNDCTAYAARLARVKCIPCFPITPQTHFLELIAEWKAEGKFDAEFNVLESEHSVLSAALGSEMTGARTFTSSGSQGIMLMHEMLPIVSGTRMPVVMVNGSRSLSAPISLWCDHADFLSCRDFGWLMVCSETNQELLDSIIIAFKVSENKKILLPSLVNMDGFIQSYTRTEVDLPPQKLVDKFLPPLKLEVKLDVNNPMSLGIPAMTDYMYFRSQVHKAQLDSIPVFEQAHKEWAKLTGRKYGLVEEYNLSDARTAIVMIGSNTTIAKAAVDSLRKKGKKVGLLRLRLIRPFPEKTIAKSLKGIEKIAVVDQNLAPGIGGILFPEVKAALHESRAVVSSYVTGLGGKPVSRKDYENIFLDVLNSKNEMRKWLL